MKITMPMDLAMTVLNRREELGMTQQDLATKISASRKWVSDLEHGKATVELYRVIDVLWALGLQMNITPSEEPLPS